MSLLPPKAHLWTALPPVPLRNVGTPQVESVAHYVARLAWLTGTSVKRIVSLAAPYDEPGTRQACSSSAFCGPGKVYKRRIQNLEALTGVTTLRCGSLWVLDDLLSSGAVGRSSRLRRWCPRCYLEWDDASSCEPLLWSIDLSVVCHIHGCDLESKCHHCGAGQQHYSRYRRRRHCLTCGTSLAGEGVRTTRSPYSRWVEDQLAELVRHCATPGTSPVPGTAFQQFVSATRASQLTQSSAKRAAFYRLVKTNGSSRGTRVRLDTLMYAGAVQNIAICDFLLNPVQAAATPLPLDWGGYEQLGLRFENDYAPDALRHCLDLLLREPGNIYLPHPSTVMREMKTSRRRLCPIARRTFKAYLSSYRAQLPASQHANAERNFRIALRFMRADQKNPFSIFDRKGAISRLARAFGFPREYAREMLVSTTRFRRSVELAWAKALGLSSHELKIQKKLGRL